MWPNTSNNNNNDAVTFLVSVSSVLPKDDDEFPVLRQHHIRNHTDKVFKTKNKLNVMNDNNNHNNNNNNNNSVIVDVGNTDQDNDNDNDNNEYEFEELSEYECEEEGEEELNEYEYEEELNEYEYDDDDEEEKEVHEEKKEEELPLVSFVYTHPRRSSLASWDNDCDYDYDYDYDDSLSFGDSHFNSSHNSDFCFHLRLRHLPLAGYPARRRLRFPVGCSHSEERLSHKSIQSQLTRLGGTKNIRACHAPMRRVRMRKNGNVADNDNDNDDNEKKQKQKQKQNQGKTKRHVPFYEPVWPESESDDDSDADEDGDNRHHDHNENRIGNNTYLPSSPSSPSSSSSSSSSSVSRWSRVLSHRAVVASRRAAARSEVVHNNKKNNKKYKNKNKNKNKIQTSRFTSNSKSKSRSRSGAVSASSPLPRSFSCFDLFARHFYDTHFSSLSTCFQNEYGLRLCGFRSLAEYLSPHLTNRFLSAMAEVGSYPALTFHGTSGKNMQSIINKGLLVPGSGGVKVENGSAYGVGIYSSRSASYSTGYTRGTSTMFVCATIDRTPNMKMASVVNFPRHGQNYTTNSVRSSGNIVVVSDPSLILPVFLMDFDYESEKSTLPQIHSQSAKSLTNFIYQLMTKRRDRTARAAKLDATMRTKNCFDNEE